jgi:hypothetical protein
VRHLLEWVAVGWAVFVLVPALILNDGHPRGVFLATLFGVWGVASLLQRREDRVAARRLP